MLLLLPVRIAYLLHTTGKLAKFFHTTNKQGFVGCTVNTLHMQGTPSLSTPLSAECFANYTDKSNAGISPLCGGNKQPSSHHQGIISKNLRILGVEFERKVVLVFS